MLPLLAALLMSSLPTPSPRQIEWQRMGQYAFVHFGPNTFTDEEWGGGKEDPALFNPTAFDARQWARSFKAGGLNGIVLTAKHHDGFCLWPSKLSTHTVAQSPFRRDVLKEVSDACRAEGLKFGVYLSPWDRNHPAYGSPEYNKVFAGMLKEVLTHYGPVFEVWFDGANGEGPNGKRQVYDWPLFVDTVRKYQPNAVVFSDAGPDVRWVGNEGGYAAPTNWATIDRDRYVPGTPLYAELTEGKRGGKDWVPAECDVSIRPGWFYHADQDAKVKTPSQLLDLWERSVGQNANLLLNVPPDRTGRIHENDVKALKGFAVLREATYGHDLAAGATLGASVGRVAKDGWTTPEGTTGGDLTVALRSAATFDRVELREPTQMGQRIAAFVVEAREGSRWKEIAKGTTVGYRRIVRVEPTQADAVRIRVTDSLAPPLLSGVSIYASPAALGAELAEMVATDQKARSAVFKGGKIDDLAMREMARVDAEHLPRVKAIFSRVGFPRKSVYGAGGSQNFWLLVQHSDRDPAFQAAVLAKMKPLEKAGEVAPDNVAYLEDRVRVNHGRPQLYGTQDSKPIEDPAHVDDRRLTKGMVPLAAYQRLLKGYKATGRFPLAETKEDRDARLAWWREARFGMFVHWGLYSVPAGEWRGTKYGGGVEWLMNMAKIPAKEYEPLAKAWNPTRFDAREWVRVCKDAGMRYLVITSKHHEGFGLWPSKQGDWNVKRTPFKNRDVLKELAAECKKEGIRLCFYHSIMDWRHPDYLPKRDWDKAGAAKADFDRYVLYMKAQLKELLTDYGDIGILWFDGEWEGTWTNERGSDLYDFVRTIQPGLIVNNRVSKGRNGMQGMTAGEAAGDYGTPEQTIPANGLPGLDWESCMTMNDTWGYSAHDHNWKSAETLVRNLIDCASKGGNYLLNVGPKADGTIPPESVERLAEVGRWTKANGEAIYGTTAGPFPRALPWGRVTRKGNRLYLMVYEGDKILLPGLKADIVGIKGLDGRAAPYKVVEGGVEVDLTRQFRFPHATVFAMDVRGPIEVVPFVPKMVAGRSLDLPAPDAEIRGGTAQLQGDNIGYWTDVKDAVSWTFEAVRGEVEVEMEYACEPGSEGANFAVEVGGQTLKGKIESTGGWNVFRRVKLGKVALVVGGKTELTVRPLTKPGLGVMNLRSIRLT